ncbi:MAG: CopG family transcriptional regulator [Trueperaceae bacterium]|nr:CopG family transcriptional regulator [Trueperaceae bacterium]
MKRTTVYLSEAIDLELARLARQEGRSKIELIREVLKTFVAQKKTEQQDVPSWLGAGRSNVSDLAERADEFLAEIYEEKYARIMTDYEEDHPQTREDAET